MVVVRKTIRMMEGQQFLFHQPRYFFYITNLPKRTMPTARIVAESNSRCDQENILAQGKAMGALSAPLHDLTSNWAYMVTGMLAWNLKCWLSLSLKEAGNAAARKKRREQKHKLLRTQSVFVLKTCSDVRRRSAVSAFRTINHWSRMDFATFRQQLIEIPTQVLRSGRQFICRLLTWTPAVEQIFLLHESTNLPLRH